MSYEINVLSIINNLLFIPLISNIIFPFTLICIFIPKLTIILKLFTNILEFLSVTCNKISNISFRENVLSREMDSQNAILMLRDPNASVKFEHNQEIAQNADASSSNPITAIGYKLYKTFSLIKDSNSNEMVQEQKQNHLKLIA